MVEAKNEPHATGWHVGKEIPLALIATFILTIAAQSFWLGMWVSSQNARVSDIEKSVSAIEKKLERQPPNGGCVSFATPSFSGQSQPSPPAVALPATLWGVQKNQIAAAQSDRASGREAFRTVARSSRPERRWRRARNAGVPGTTTSTARSAAPSAAICGPLWRTHYKCGLTSDVLLCLYEISSAGRSTLRRKCRRCRRHRGKSYGPPKAQQETPTGRS